MGRNAVKAAGNAYFEARKKIAKTDERFCSREGAAEVIGIGADSLSKYESGLCKVVPPDNVLLMAIAYKAPELLNWYCSTQCPIGQQTVGLIDLKPLAVVSLSMVHMLDSADAMKRALVEITHDGVITDDEISTLVEIMGYLDNIERVIAQLKLWVAQNNYIGFGRVS